MDDERYGQYNIKVNRLFNITQRKLYRTYVWLLAVFLMALVLYIFTDKVSIERLFFCFVFCVVYLTVVLLSYPKRIEVTPGSAKVVYRHSLQSLLRYGRIAGTFSNYKTQKTVYNIKSIEYMQSPFEKRFSVGRMCFIGDVMTIQDETPFVEEGEITIYGVMDFENTSEWMKDFIKLENN